MGMDLTGKILSVTHSVALTLLARDGWDRQCLDDTLGIGMLGLAHRTT